MCCFYKNEYIDIFYTALSWPQKKVFFLRPHKPNKISI